MSAMASPITSLTIVYSTVYSGADQRKHKSSASLAFVRGIHRWPVNSPQGASNAEHVSIWWRLMIQREIDRWNEHWIDDKMQLQLILCHKIKNKHVFRCIFGCSITIYKHCAWITHGMTICHIFTKLGFWTISIKHMLHNAIFTFWCWKNPNVSWICHDSNSIEIY